MSSDSYYCAVKCFSSANKSKSQMVSDVIDEYAKTMCLCLYDMDVKMQQEMASSRFTSLKSSDFDFRITTNYVQTAYSQAHGTYVSWLTKLTDKVRSFITFSTIDEFDKTTLYRINARHLWYAHNVSLDWMVADGIMSVPSKRDSVKSIPVPDELMKLSRRLIKRARRLVHRPDLSKSRSMLLDSKEVRMEHSKSNTVFPYWVRMSTLVRGKRVLLPMKANPYFDKSLSKGKLLKSLQISVFDEGRVSVSPIIECQRAPLRTEGRSIGLDWGATSLFSTSDGRMVGRRMLCRLRELDKVLTDYTADMQRRRKPLKKDARFISLRSRISSYVKNEVGRVLNRLAEDDVRRIVVEKLDFRNGGLSRRMNRIVSLAGRHAVEAKLERLRDEKGIDVVHVEPAYTSQQCSRCGFVDKGNRRSQSSFKCLCCGHVANADVNAAINILGRSKDALPTGRGKAGRKTIRHALLDKHSLHCPSGRHGATMEITGPMAPSEGVGL